MKAITVVAALFATLALGAPVANQDHSTTDAAWHDHRRNVDVQEGADAHSTIDDANYWVPLALDWVRKRNIDVQDGVEEQDHSTTDAAWRDHKRNVDEQEEANDHSNTDDVDIWYPGDPWMRRKRNVDVQEEANDHSTTDDTNN